MSYRSNDSIRAESAPAIVTDDMDEREAARRRSHVGEVLPQGRAHFRESLGEHIPTGAIRFEPSEVVFVALRLIEPPRRNASVGQLFVGEFHERLDPVFARVLAARGQPLPRYSRAFFMGSRESSRTKNMGHRSSPGDAFDDARSRDSFAAAFAGVRRETSKRRFTYGKIWWRAAPTTTPSS